MARPAKQDNDIGVVPTKDFARVKRIFFSDIRRLMTQAGEVGQELSTAHKTIKQDCNVQGSAAKQAFKLQMMEESKRDDWWRSFLGMVKELDCGPPGPDLVDMMTTSPKPKPQLVTVGKSAALDKAKAHLGNHPADDSDLAGELGPDGAAESEAEF